MHHAFISDFTVPTAGVWYCVFFANDEVDTITICYGIDVDTSGAYTPTTSDTASTTTTGDIGGELMMSPVLMGILAAAVIGVVLCFVCRGRRSDGPSAPTVDHYVAPPSSPSSGTVREREVTTRVLVVCPYCGVGCQLELQVKKDRIIGVSPKGNGTPNRGQACVKGRFGIAEYVHHPDRLKTPLIRQNGGFREASWEEALDMVAERLEGLSPQEVAVISSAKCTNEENYLAQKFARAVLGTNNVDHCARL